MLYFIEGNIGVGKSTLIERLKKTLKRTNTTQRIKFLTEPLNVWTNYNGVNMLQKFYDNPTKNALKFQLLTFMSVYEQIMDNYDKYDILVCERSPYTIRHVFIEMLYNNGHLTEIEYKLLTDFIDIILKHSNLKYRFIYLNASSQTCLKRIKTRNRPEEQDIKIEYLDNLKKYHDNYFKHNKYTKILNII